MKIITSRYAQLGLALIIAVLLIASITSSAAAAGPVYHTVHWGQTLYSIANHYGTSVWAIACANGIYNPNYVYAGQVLLIPQGGHDGCKPGHKPVQKDGWDDGHNDGKGDGQKESWDDGHKDGYDDGQKESWDDGHKDGYDNGPKEVKYHPQPEPKKNGCYYTVRWGENLFRIALKYDVSWKVIAHENDLHNGNYIYAGQVLRVPCVW